MEDQREIAAHHEAGHAVAAVLRGESSLRSVVLNERDGEGITWSRAKPFDRGFIAWAGPWAEARYQWGARPLSAWPYGEPVDVTFGEDGAPVVTRPEPEDEPCDEDGCTFADYVTAALFGQYGSDDGDQTVVSAHERWQEATLAQSLGEDLARILSFNGVSLWAQELESVWPAVQRVASMLLAGEPVDDSTVRALVEVE